MPGTLTGRRPPVDRGAVHYCAEACVHITPVERVILEHLMRGYSNKELAHVMGIREQSIKTHLARLFVKLQVDDRLQLALVAIASGITHMTLPRQ